MNRSSTDSFDAESPCQDPSKEIYSSPQEAFKKETSAEVICISPSESHTSEHDATQPSVGCWETNLRGKKYSKHFSTFLKEDLSSAQGNNASGHDRAWKTTFFRFGPVSGIFCMLLAAAAMVSSLGVLAGSDGQPVNDWSAPPSTYLAIFTAVANLCVRYAAAQGVIVAWWTLASNGVTAAKLHWAWSSGTSLKGALTAGRHTSLLALACIMSTIIVVDGPLLQRASTVIQAPAVPALLDISMTPELADGLTGFWSSSAQLGLPGKRWSFLWNATIPTVHGSGISNYIWPSAYISSMNEPTGRWLGSKSLAGVVRGCPKDSSCAVKIKAPALWPTSCTNHLHTIDFLAPIHVDSILQEKYAAPLTHDVFFIDSSLDLSGAEEKINLITGFTTPDPTCQQLVLNYTICTLRSAIGEYDVSIRGKKVEMEAIQTPRFVSFAENAVVNHTWNPEVNGHTSTLAGIVASMNDKWNTVLIQYEGNDEVNGINFQQSSFEEYSLPTPSTCPSYRDPQQDVLRSLNQFMFYVGASAASVDRALISQSMNAHLPTHYTTTGSRLVNHSVFATEYRFFAGAAVVMVMCILLISPTYWNWWKLGRPVSFSPLEIAKAFESPMFEQYNSNSSGRDLARVVDDNQIKYGLVQSSGAEEIRRVAFANAASVTAPQEGTVFES